MTPEQFNKAIGAVLERERKVRGLTLEVLGKELGISYQQVQKFTRGINNCSAYQIQRFAEIFEVPVGYIYGQADMPQASARPTAADNDSFLAARYVQRIADPKLRSNIVDFTRKLAYSAGAA